MTFKKVDTLVLGSGGREDALLRKLAESPRVGRLWAAPGNAGMLERAEGADLDIASPLEVARFAHDHAIDLVVIGPEAPLVAGVADAVRAAGVACFGPNADAARMEGSKRFAKRVMAKAGVPTARYRSFEDEESCEAYVRDLGGACVIKADGLAAGKGVIVAKDADEAVRGMRTVFSGAFGEAAEVVLVEEALAGPECSLLALTDGTTLVPLATSQDHKRALDGDRGPNTGGMGVYSPVPAVTTAELEAMVRDMQLVVDQLRADGSPYSGCLYGGFMLTEDGPKVLEFNARFGDPETQVVLPRMRGDLLEAMLACDAGTLSPDMLSWDDDWALSVVLTSAGYPGHYETGKPITGVERAEALDGVTVYHAGTRRGDDGALLTAGGRVLDVTAVGESLQAARDRAYEAVGLIDFEGKTYRTDIGWRALSGARRQDA